MKTQADGILARHNAFFLRSCGFEKLLNAATEQRGRIPPIHHGIAQNGAMVS
jgi:hypothetical protein